MSLVLIPPSPVAAKIDWKPGARTQVNESEWSAAAQTVILAGAPRWRASVTYPPIVGEANILAWRAFVVDLEGSAHWFRLVACERDQIVGVAPVVAGAGQGGHQLVTRNWGAAGLKLRRGQFATIGGQLLMLMADVVADDAGVAPLRFKPYLREIPADGAAIEVRRPYATMAMVDDEAGWSVGIGQNYQIQFDCRERF